MKIIRNERKRVLILLLIFFTWLVVIAATLVKIQVLDYNKYVTRIKAQKNRIVTLHPKRGTIYDCWGEPLAISVKAKSAFISSKNRPELYKIFNLIKKSLKFNANDRKFIQNRIKRGERFSWIRRKLTKNEYLKLKRIGENFENNSVLGFVDEYKRIYPHRSMASHILGGVGIDEQGLFGIEFGLDSVIRGKGGIAKVELDARRKIFRLDYVDMPIAGKDVYLSIDLSIQFFVEKALARAVRKFRAKGGTVIIMESKSGSILAMASFPGYAPDRIRYLSSRVLKNKAVSFLFDPGSTFKIVLASSALENNICYPQQVFNCYNGVFKLGGEKIRDHKPYGRLTFEDIVVYSSNIGAARVGLKLGKKKFYKDIKKFGFGSSTGIGLPAEEKGILNPLKRWSKTSVAFLSFGYEIMVTPLQMTRAFNAIANNGYLISPNIVKRIDGIKLKKKEKQKIFSISTRERMTSIMMEVVNRGTGKKARVEGIDVAGKTGTAKILKNGKYQDVYISSFGGFFPAGNPKVTMFVLIEEPHYKYYGGDVAAPLFKSIAKKLLIYLNIFPELDKKNEIRL